MFSYSTDIIGLYGYTLRNGSTLKQQLYFYTFILYSIQNRELISIGNCVWCNLFDTILYQWKVSVSKMEPNCDIKHIPIYLDADNLKNEAIKILKEIRSEWNEDDIIIELLTEGKTNKLVECNLRDGNPENTVLVRVYGNNTELLIDRAIEMSNIILLNRYKLAPKLYATFSNGLAYEFVPGRTLTDVSVRDPVIYPLIARQMARLHRLNVADGDATCMSTEPVLWPKLDQFLKLVPRRYKDEQTQKRFIELIKPVSVLKEEVELMKEKLTALNNPIVFCHNDLLLANVIYTEEKQKVTFIDLEYAGYNYQAYDIGNHFAEFVGFDIVDYTKFPGKELQCDWLRHYLSVAQKNFTEGDLEKMYIEVNHFVLATHLVWGIWALIQAEHSHIEFDYLEYASIRFNEYFATKDKILNMSYSS